MVTKTFKATSAPAAIDNARKNGTDLANLEMDVANISREPEGNQMKTSGIKIRGCGAATKGTTARGPMA